MGYSSEATCRACGHTFTVSKGGGFAFHLLRCDRCGRERSVSFEELGEAHLRYRKGLPGPYSIATQEGDDQGRTHHPGPSMSEEEYNREVEMVGGDCECGGNYRIDTPPRCPSCRSTDLASGEPTVFYD